MKPLPSPVSSKQHAYMRMRQNQNRALCSKNSNENWLYDKLIETGYPWTRQAQWGFRLFDFWCSSIGVAVESDGKEHDHNYDAYRDEYNFRRSAIIVLRIKNRNNADWIAALKRIRAMGTWNDRRLLFGVLPHGKVPLIFSGIPEHRNMLSEYINSIDTGTDFVVSL